MKTENNEQLLERKGLKKTKVRMNLLQHFMKMKHAQSYSDLQAAFAKELDKSTLYRNLTAFEEAGIIHRINDHSGVGKYAFGAVHDHDRNHAHFVCELCETVFCIEKTTVDEINVPEGFKTNKIQTIVRGTCANC